METDDGVPTWGRRVTNLGGLDLLATSLHTAITPRSRHFLSKAVKRTVLPETDCRKIGWCDVDGNVGCYGTVSLLPWQPALLWFEHDYLWSNMARLCRTLKMAHTLVYWFTSDKNTNILNPAILPTPEEDCIYLNHVTFPLNAWNFTVVKFFGHSACQLTPNNKLKTHSLYGVSTSSTVFKKCGAKTSIGGQEHYVLEPQMEPHTYIHKTKQNTQHNAVLGLQLEPPHIHITIKIHYIILCPITQFTTPHTHNTTWNTQHNTMSWNLIELYHTYTTQYKIHTIILCPGTPTVAPTHTHHHENTLHNTMS